MMTPKEYRAAIKEFTRQIDGRRPCVTTYINRDGEFVMDASVYTDWPMSERVFEVEANDFDELLILLKDKWESYKETNRTRTIRKMALAIIRITAELGECTDAALRADVFSAEEVARYASDACADADKIASNGPFSVTRAAKANAA